MQGGDFEQDYTPPSVDSNGTGHVHTSYDLDQNPTSIAPDGLPSIVPGCETSTGRLSSVARPRPSQGRSLRQGDGSSVICPMISVTGTPASTWRSASAICSSVNLDFRIGDSLLEGLSQAKF